jgi:spore photoproduct lyase
MSLVKKTVRKSLKIKESGRSTDFITPSFGFGCLYNCSYCYCKRHVNDGLSIAENVDQILDVINNHYFSLGGWFQKNKPNQTDPDCITYDIGCNEDLALHAKHHDIQRILSFSGKYKRMMFSFATKYVNYDLPNIWSNPTGPGFKSVRIRFSLMPQKYSDILEPNTSSILERIDAIDKFIAKGYEVHINFSPVIVTDTWLEDYRDLFLLVDEHVINKDHVKCEVIFLTHNEKKHLYNLANNIQGEDMLWRPEIQEPKKSQYGGDNIRYKHQLKSNYVYQFKALHNAIIPWNTIRYIF